MQEPSVSAACLLTAPLAPLHASHSSERQPKKSGMADPECLAENEDDKGQEDPVRWYGDVEPGGQRHGPSGSFARSETFERGAFQMIRRSARDGAHLCQSQRSLRLHAWRMLDRLDGLVIGASG